MEKSGLTTAIMANKTDPFLIMKLEMKISENRPAARVGKREIFYVDQQIILVHCNKPTTQTAKSISVIMSRSEVLKENSIRS